MVSLFKLVLVFLFFIVKLLSKFIVKLLSRNRSITAGSSTPGSALSALKELLASFCELLASFCGGSVVGILIAVTYELLRFTAPQPWLRATIGPPLFLVDIVLGFTFLIALLERLITELEREWWGRLVRAGCSAVRCSG